MLTDDRTIQLWRQLSSAFNVHVRDIGVGRTNGGDECTLVTVDDKTDPSVIAGLPKKFANEVVEYKVAASVPYLPGCGQAGHRCVCAPKSVLR